MMPVIGQYPHSIEKAFFIEDKLRVWYTSIAFWSSDATGSRINSVSAFVGESIFMRANIATYGP
jgi:hypothetical protein